MKQTEKKDITFIQTKNDSNKFQLKDYLSGILTGVLIFFLVNTFILSPLANNILRKNYVKASEINGLIDEKKINGIMGILDKYYVGEYDKEQMIEDMYYGLVQGVGDPYTTYMDKDIYERFIEETEGIYAGIGVTVSIDPKDNSIVIITPFEGYPGANSGMLPGDKIIQVNGYDVSGDTLDKAVSMMRGKPGTSVDVAVFRPDENKIIEMEILREEITMPTVNHKMMENDIGYIRITQFERNTDHQFFEAYEELQNMNMKGLIIDLRNNPGGLLNVVANITNSLIPEGTIVYTEDKNGKRDYLTADSNHIEVPLLVLVNGNSASASEVLSGAVQDTGIGELVGTQTFGKGLVQNIFELEDGTALKITIAKYYTPNGICIQDIGLTPNYEIDMDNVLTVKISSLTLEEDIQLKKAYDVMLDKIK